MDWSGLFTRLSARLLVFMQKRPLRAAGWVLAAVLVIGLGSCAVQAPRNDRVWYPYLSHTSQVVLSDADFEVRPVSDWTYDAEGVTAERYISAGYTFDQLRNVWFVLEPQPGSKLAAHTLLLFEFEGDRMLGLTIEARRETDEDYSAWDGLWNRYELAYVWASARDLLVRRAVMLDHEVFVYPVAINETQERVLLQRVLARTQELGTRPRFYNTLFSNCTNELAKATDLDWHYSFVLTGTSDNHLYREGIIPGASFAEASARADFTAFLKQANDEVAPEDFDAALLAELRARNADVLSDERAP